MSITMALSDSDFPGVRHFVDWAQLAASGPLPDTQLPASVMAVDAAYQLDGVTIDIDISAGRNVQISRRRPLLVESCFASSESVLMASNIVGQPVIRLDFNPGLRSVGARVGAFGNDTVEFWAQCQVFVSDGRKGNWLALDPRKGRHEVGRTGARFMGATADRGFTIRAIWFDALDLSEPDGDPGAPSVVLTDVGIGNLFFVP